MRPSKTPPTRLALSLYCLGLGAAVAPAQTTPAQSPPTQSPSQTPLNPSTTVPLPKGPPPTGPQSQVPDPKAPLPDPNHPILRSPTPQEIAGVVANQTLTINDAVAIALVTNRPFATAAASLERARALTNQARTALNPTAGVNAGITYYDVAQTAAFGGQTIVLANRYNPLINPTISLPVDISGAARAAINQAQFNEVAARIDVNRVRNQLVFDVRNAFYQALRDQGQLVVAQDNLANALQRLVDANRNYTAGTVSQFDVVTAQRDVSDAQQGVVNARGQVTLALGQLKNVMGVDVSTPIRISDAGAVEEPPGVQPVHFTLPAPPPLNLSPTPNPANTPPAPTNLPTPNPTAAINTLPQVTVADAHVAQDAVDLGPEYTSAVQEAVQTRPEVLESEAQISAAQRGIYYARRTQLPSLSLSAGYMYQPNAGAFTLPHEASLGVNLNIPIFDAGLARARVQEARAGVATAEVSRRTAVDQVTLDVQQAYVNLIQARDRVQVTDVELAQAQEAFRLAQVRYNAGVSQTTGVSPQLELSNTQTTLTQAETNRLNALYDYNVARSQLDRAIGRYSYGYGAGYPGVPSPKTTGQPQPSVAAPTH